MEPRPTLRRNPTSGRGPQRAAPAPAARAILLRRVLVALTVVGAALHVGVLLHGVAAATAGAPIGAPQAGPAAALPGLALVIALGAVVTAGLLRWNDTARLTGAVLAAAGILGTLLGAIRLAVFPAEGLVGGLLLGLACIAADAAWLAVAFRPVLAAAFRRRRG